MLLPSRELSCKNVKMGMLANKKPSEMEKEHGRSHMRETLFCSKSRCMLKQRLFGEEL